MNIKKYVSDVSLKLFLSKAALITLLISMGFQGLITLWIEKSFKVWKNTNSDYSGPHISKYLKI